MVDSILTSVKKVLGLVESDTTFDQDIILYTNGALSTLNQLGVGPEDGFQIEDASATWTDFQGDDLRLNNVKTFTYLTVRLLFDPPGTSFAITAIEKQIAELASRINIVVETDRWQ